MVREREMGIPEISHIADSSTGSKLQSVHPQNSAVEIFDTGSLERKKLFRRTPFMQGIEEQHEGRSIKEILYDLYWIQEKSCGQVGRELGRPDITIYSWLIKLGIGTRSLLDVLRARNAVKRQPGAISSPTKTKLNEDKKRFEIESDEVLKTFLEEKYKQYKSQGAMSKAFRDIGIKVGKTIVKNWMSYLGIKNTLLLLEEHNKSSVKKAFETGDFGRLTQKQQHILEIRGYLGEEPLVPFRKLEEVRVGRITFQAAHRREVMAFSRLGKGTNPVGRPGKYTL